MSNESATFSSQTIRKISREIRQLVKNPIDGIQYLPNESSQEEDLKVIQVEIIGPETTPYEGGFFKIQLKLTKHFPNEPPKGFFKTKIYHPNIAPNTGEICVSALKKDWSSTLGFGHILQVIRCLMIIPSPDSALNDEAGRLFMDNYVDYANRAKVMTKIHASKSCDSLDLNANKRVLSQEGNSKKSVKKLCANVSTSDKEKRLLKKRSIMRL